MADTTKTFQEALDELHIEGGYAWRPNRFFVKQAGEYYSADTYADASVQEIADAVSVAGAEAIDEIEDLGNVKLNILRTREHIFENVQDNVLQTYQRLYSYFSHMDVPELAEVVTDAISEINEL